MNQLVIHKEDANVLLHQKNVLNESVVDKYRTAGQITETALKFIVDIINEIFHFQTRDPLTIQELCLITDSFLQNGLNKVYVKGGFEKSISTPTSFNINEFVSNFSPEINDNGGYYFKEGDLVTINFGVQIDGYTSNVSHTICIFPAGDKPVGPLLGPKADCIIANYFSTEVVTGLLGLSMSPEKIPAAARQKFGDKVTGKMIKEFVNEVVGQFNCTVIPGSEVRVIRRFLTGQNDVIEEKGYKGISWDEKDQEITILRKLGIDKTKTEDDFVVNPGEIYQINLKIASVGEASQVGVVVVDAVKEHSGLNNKQEFNMKPTIFVRDFIMNYQLKLKNSRALLGKVDKTYSVYPFKLTFLADGFPLSDYFDEEQRDAIKGKVNENKLGLSELLNRNLVNARPVETVKFVPLKTLLHENSTSELINPLQMQKLARNAAYVTDKSVELTTVMINDLTHEVLKLTNTQPPVYSHSNYKLGGEAIETVLTLLGDKKFGITVKKVQPTAVKAHGAA